MSLQMLESMLNKNTDRNTAERSNKTYLTAQWLVVNNKLICKWITL